MPFGMVSGVLDGRAYWRNLVNAVERLCATAIEYRENVSIRLSHTTTFTLIVMSTTPLELVFLLARIASTLFIDASYCCRCPNIA